MNQKKIKKATENGRSMVEMLGVLAIIGVLSVSGIAGYKSAITKHRANETIDRLLKRAVVIAGQVGLGQQADISGFNQDDGTYTIGLTTPEAGATSFVLNVAAVPEEVCQKIKDMWTLPSIVPGNCEEGTNDMTFAFNNDLSEGGNGGNGGNTPTEPTNPCTGKSDYTSCENDKICFSEHCQVDCRGPSHITDINAMYYYPNCPEHCITMTGAYSGCHNSEAEARSRCGGLPWERVDDKRFYCD